MRQGKEINSCIVHFYGFFEAKLFTLCSLLSNRSSKISLNMLRNALRTLMKKPGRSILSRNVSSSSQPQHEITENGKTVSDSKENEIDMFKFEDYFNVKNIFTVKDMFDAKVHLGHKEASLNDKMRPYVFGSRLGHIIFDLDITAYHLRKALNFCAHIAYKDGIILFVSHNKMCTVLVENTAQECKEFAYSRNWIQGLFLRPVSIFKIETRLPDLCIFLNTKFETGQQHAAVVEASKALIPVVGVVDSDCDPSLITYPVPGNDDTQSSVEFFCNAFKTAILRGKMARKENSVKH